MICLISFDSCTFADVDVGMFLPVFSVLVCLVFSRLHKKILSGISKNKKSYSVKVLKNKY